eukprot:3903400-Ditylum_brightwellii.AAC.1
MPPNMPIDTVSLGTWKLYRGQLAIKIKKEVIKTFEEHGVVIKGTNKSKPSARFFLNTMK